MEDRSPRSRCERGEVQAVLEDAQRAGLLGGSTPVDHHIRQAEALAALVAEVAGHGPGLDLGSGPGVPGLVLADMDPNRPWHLLDASEKRCEFAQRAVARLGLGNAEVLQGRAEDLGRVESLRGSFAVVVARAFGPPPSVAELGRPFLADDGVLIVSEPPGREARWDPSGLAAVGLGEAALREVDGYGFSVLAVVGPCPDRYPRRTAAARRRPLW